MDKTELLVHPQNTEGEVQFADGTAVNMVTSSKYLGSLVSWDHVSWDHPAKVAVQQRHFLAHTAYTKLHHLWRSNIPVKDKVCIFLRPP